MNSIIEEFENALIRGDTESIRNMLNVEDQNLDTTTITTLLHLACANGNGAVVNALLKKKKVNINAKNSQGRTPLAEACIYGKRIASLLLIEKGADPNITDSLNNTPVILALMYKHYKIVNKFVIQGLVTDDEINQILLKAHFDTILVYPIEHCKNVNIKNEKQQTLLHLACIAGCEAWVIKLLEKGANVNVSNKDEETPLQLACRAGNVAIVRMLLERDADVNVADKWGETPLHQACRARNVVIVGMLLELGVDVNAANENGRTPLHFVSMKDNVKIFKMLLEKHANIDAIDVYGNTSLHYIVGDGPNKKEEIKLLIERKANLSITNSNGFTPLELAFKEEDICFMYIFIEKGLVSSDRINRFLIESNFTVDERLIIFLLKYCKNFNIKNNDEETLLHLACKANNRTLIRTLLKENIDVNAVDKNGNTPFSLLNEQLRSDMVRMFR